MAPQVGLEPTTTRLTAECSAIELLRNMESGGDLCFRAVSSQVRSALRGLTSVFGMGTGGTLSSLPPEMVSYSVAGDGFPSLMIPGLPSPAVPLPSDLPALASRLLPPGSPCFRSVPPASASFRLRSLALSPHPDNCTAMILTDRFQLVSLSWTLR